MISNKKIFFICKRLFDIIFATLGIFIFTFPFLLLFALLKPFSKCSFLYWSERAGLNSKSFKMAKLRTMKFNTPELPDNMLCQTNNYYLFLGKFLRKYGIDELPQLFNILIGDMSFVGPRPVMFKDLDLITERKKKGIDILRPGLTGLAQINGRNNLSTFEKVTFDEYYLYNISFLMDIKIIFKTNIFLFNENLNGKYSELKKSNIN